MIETDPQVIHAIIASHNEIVQHLLANGEVSFSATLESSVPKFALLSAASWTEDQVQRILVDLFEETLPETPHKVNFVKAAGIERRYHTWFSWDKSNANKFFSMFGLEFKKYCEEQIQNDPHLTDSISAFMELGRLRNELVHQNFATFRLEKSLDEVRILFTGAAAFVSNLPRLLRMEYATSHAPL